ncbi:MAG: hypothetical protein WHS82_02685 [Candidatus Methanosuratincola sp.]
MPGTGRAEGKEGSWLAGRQARKEEKEGREKGEWRREKGEGRGG